ncbi:hypothetical protein F5Y19DRAFT_451230 [Xylariaceae sp. FL1651]|nr:hypothetical protein F5Y19DRAFT_451230 [Xylariaceae sp. FL1651]
MWNMMTSLRRLSLRYGILGDQNYDGGDLDRCNSSSDISIMGLTMKNIVESGAV